MTGPTSSTTRLQAALAFSAVLIAMLATGCGDSTSEAGGGSGDGASMGDLSGLTFFSTNVTQNDEPHDLVSGTRISLQFSTTGLTANAGCNTMSGDALFTRNVLIVKGAGLATTEMGCDPARMDQDSWLADILGTKPTVTLDGDQLRLTSGDIVIDFLDKKTVEPDQPLVGTAWMLDAIGKTGDDGAVSSIPDDVESTLQIDDAGAVSLHPGCNTGRADAQITDTTVTFGPVALTRMFCEGAKGDVETAVLAVIDGEADYAIDGSVLTLTKGTNTLTYRMVDAANAAD